jgi:hypothetical protein
LLLPLNGLKRLWTKIEKKEKILKDQMMNSNNCVIPNLDKGEVSNFV